MKNLSLILIVLTIVSCLFLFSDHTHAEISLKIGSDNWSPFHGAGKSKDDVKGFTVDLVHAVLKKMNVKIASHKIYPWKRAIKMVFDGELDAVFTTTKTDERMKYCHFPKEPLTEFSYLFFIRKEDVGKLTYNTFEDLKGHKIGIVGGFSYTQEFIDFIKKEKNYEEVTVGTQNFNKLITKRIDYVASPKRVGQNYIRELGITDQCIAIKKPFMVNNLYIMFSKKTIGQEFADEFSETLRKFKTTLEYKEIVAKHKW